MLPIAICNPWVSVCVGQIDVVKCFTDLCFVNLIKDLISKIAQLYMVPSSRQ